MTRLYSSLRRYPLNEDYPARAVHICILLLEQKRSDAQLVGGYVVAMLNSTNMFMFDMLFKNKYRISILSFHVSATGATATMVDAETGETMTVTAGIPSGMAIPGAGLVGAAGVVASIGLGSTTTTTVSGGEAVYCGMSYESHDALLQSLRANPNDFMGHLDLIKGVAASNWITTDQAVAILYTLGYDIHREEAAGYMYPKMCDPENWFKIYNTIDSPAVKMDMQEKYGR